jgi:hypothetical protein
MIQVDAQFYKTASSSSSAAASSFASFAIPVELPFTAKQFDNVIRDALHKCSIDCTAVWVFKDAIGLGTPTEETALDNTAQWSFQVNIATQQNLPSDMRRYLKVAYAEAHVLAILSANNIDIVFLPSLDDHVSWSDLRKELSLSLPQMMVLQKLVEKNVGRPSSTGMTVSYLVIFM